jgi:hypothetical protein
MILLLNKENVVIDFGEEIVFAKGSSYGLQKCPKEEATHIWNIDGNVAYMNDGETMLVEVENIPAIQTYEYKYVNGEFVINEDYTPYISDTERIAALEDIVNMLLLGGNE